MHWKSNGVGSKIVVFLSSLMWTVKLMTVSANKMFYVNLYMNNNFIRSLQMPVIRFFQLY